MPNNIKNSRKSFSGIIGLLFLKYYSVKPFVTFLQCYINTVGM